MGEDLKVCRLVTAICVAVVAVASASGGFPAGAQAAGKDFALPVMATTTSHGLKITLSAPLRTYAANSLLLTTIRVKNVSARTVSIQRGGCLPTIGTVVLNKKGQPYSPPVNSYPASCGPDIGPTMLTPGAVLRESSFVVLRPGWLRADLAIETGKAGPGDIHGKVLRLTLIPAAPEHVALAYGTPGHPDAGFTATISPTLKGAGRLYVTSSESCNQANGTGVATGTFPDHWAAASGPTLHTTILHPGCGHQLWQFVAGWIGHPVAKLKVSITTS